ncbi:MAG TPA: M50 family metallopeptidase [Patescibacteria group bacterium]|nr:M50 family metallopeptidase [Patescibacteria group bacterium]
MILTAISFIILLSVLVIIHEAGHYFTAKKLGIKVEEFGFGLPPRAFGIKRGETIYSINWLPIGGFVRLYGEDEAGSGRVQVKSEKLKVKSSDEGRAFYARSAGQRALVVVAGVIMNTLLAIVIYYIFMFISGFKTELPLLGQYNFIGVDQTITSQVVISDVAKNSPAAKAGVTPGEILVKLDGNSKVNANDIKGIINSHLGKPMSITWKDPTTNQSHTATLIPRVNPPKNQGAVGIAFFSADTVILDYHTPLQKFFSGITHPINLMGYNFAIMAKLVAISFQQHSAAPVSQGLAGPVGIYSIVGTIVHIPDIKERILEILNLAGTLSISLAIFNILPIPALDGGRFFFILFEMVTRRKVNQKFESYAHAVGMAVLLLLILLITIKDIGQFFK